MVALSLIGEDLQKSRATTAGGAENHCRVVLAHIMPNMEGRRTKHLSTANDTGKAGQNVLDRWVSGVIYLLEPVLGGKHGENRRLIFGRRSQALHRQVLC